MQPSSTAATLNQIWSGDESKIAGALKSNGQVFLYNQNGILFDKTAQVNVGSLVASTLYLDPTVFQNGYLPKNDSLANGATSTPPVFQAQGGASGTGPAGTITVNPGATITTSDGGHVMLLGSAVKNQGRLRRRTAKPSSARATPSISSRAAIPRSGGCSSKSMRAGEPKRSLIRTVANPRR